MQPIFNEVLLALGILASFATIISAITPLIANLIHGGQIDPKIKAKQKKLTSFIISIGLLTISTSLALLIVIPPRLSQTAVDLYLFHHLASDDLGPVKTLVWSPDSTKLASIDQDFGALQIWDVFTGKQELVYQPPDTNINSPTWSPDEKYIAVNIDNHLNILQLENTLLRPIFVMNTPQLSQGNKVLTWSPDGTYIAAACADKTIRIWNVAAGQISSENKPIIYTLHQGNEYNLAWSPNGQYLAIESNDYTIQILSIGNGDKGSKVIHESSLSKSNFPTNIVWAPNGSALATKNADGRIIIWSFNTGKKLLDLANISSSRGPIAWSPDGQTISTTDSSGIISLYFSDFIYSKLFGISFDYIGGNNLSTYDIQWSPNDLYKAIANAKGIDIRYSDKKVFETQPPQRPNDILQLLEEEIVFISFVLGSYLLYDRFIINRIDTFFARRKRFLNAPISGSIEITLFLIISSAFYLTITSKVKSLFIVNSFINSILHDTITQAWLFGFWVSSTMIIYILAKNYLIKHLTKTGRRIRKYIKEGEKYTEQKKYTLAIESFDRALSLNSNIRKVYIARGKAYLELKELPLAIQNFDQALTFKKDSDTFFLRGEAYFAEKKYERAIEDYDQAIESKRKKNSKYYYNRAKAYLWLKDILKAREDLMRSNELAPLDIVTAWLIVWTEMGKQPFDKDTAKYVAEHLEQVAQMNPNDHIAYLCKGVASGLRGNLKKALKEVETATLLAPEDYYAYFWKGIMTLYYSQKNLDREKSKKTIEEALTLGLPPILLTPLKWLEKDHPDLFTKYAKDLLVQYNIL